MRAIEIDTIGEHFEKPAKMVVSVEHPFIIFEDERFKVKLRKFGLKWDYVDHSVLEHNLLSNQGQTIQYKRWRIRNDTDSFEIVVYPDEGQRLSELLNEAVPV